MAVQESGSWEWQFRFSARHQNRYSTANANPPTTNEATNQLTLDRKRFESEALGPADLVFGPRLRSSPWLTGRWGFRRPLRSEEERDCLAE